MRYIIIVIVALGLAACGARVEVPPGFVGKVMTKDGYLEGLTPPSATRLPYNFAYPAKMVLLDTSDTAVEESLTIFMPEDKLNLTIGIKITLSLDPNKTESLFNSISPSGSDDKNVAKISWNQIYKTYAQQIVITESREYISEFNIAQVASNLGKVNSDIRERLTRIIESKTPFKVRYAGVTNVTYPEIITRAQEIAAEKKEGLAKEQAQLELTRVALERELEETRLRRQIELEKAQIEAKAQMIQREVVDEKVLRLRELELQREWVNKWNGILPTTVLSNDSKLFIPILEKKP